MEVVGSVVGGLIGGDAAEDAAATQAAAADRASQTQERMFNKQVELQEPWRQAGQAGLNRLMYLLGLSPTGTAAPTRTLDEIRAELRQQYPAPVAPQQSGTSMVDGQQVYWINGQPHRMVEGSSVEDYRYVPINLPQQQASAPGFDIGARAQEIFNQQQAQAAQAQTNAAKDPAFGSLMRDFSMKDFQADPGYAFRQSEGMKALERSAAARGGLYSGRAMKDTLRFGQGLASEEFGNAFNRFQINRQNKLNPLQSLAGVGQTAAGTLTNAAGNLGNSLSNIQASLGNAQAAAGMARGSAYTNAIGQGIGAYQQNKLMDMIFNRGGIAGMGGGGGYGTAGLNNHFFGFGTGGD